MFSLIICAHSAYRKFRSVRRRGGSLARIIPPAIPLPPQAKTVTDMRRRRAIQFNIFRSNLMFIKAAWDQNTMVEWPFVAAVERHNNGSYVIHLAVSTTYKTKFSILKKYYLFHSAVDMFCNDSKIYFLIYSRKIKVCKYIIKK